MEENKNNIENTNIEKAKMILSSSPEQIMKKSHEEYIKDFKQEYNLKNTYLNVSTKVLLFSSFVLYNEDGTKNDIKKHKGYYIKGIDHNGNECYYIQKNALYATTVEQIKVFENMRHYYFTMMSNNILKDNFNVEINDED